MEKLKKGDTVEVLAGRNKGERGKILEVFREESKVRVEGVFVQKRHVKAGARPSMPSGGIIDRPGKIHISNVRLWSERLERGVRVGIHVDKDGNKIRVARGRKISGKELD